MIGPGIGVEVGSRVVRAVRPATRGWRGRPAQVVEIECDATNPRDVATSLREHLARGGGASRIALEIGRAHV